MTEPVREVTITGAMDDWGKYGTQVDQVTTTVIYSNRDSDGQTMRMPYTRAITLCLTGSARPWQLARWHADSKVGKTSPSPELRAPPCWGFVRFDVACQ